MPQGGPDLTADDARAHEDLPFIWDVADAIMAVDPRALWLLATLRGTSAVMTGPVRSGEKPVLAAGRDGDGERLLLCETADLADDGHLVHLHHAVDDDPSLVEILDLEPGQYARRAGRGEPWERFSGEL